MDTFIVAIKPPIFAIYWKYYANFCTGKFGKFGTGSKFSQIQDRHDLPVRARKRHPIQTPMRRLGLYPRHAVPGASMAVGHVEPTYRKFWTGMI